VLEREGENQKKKKRRNYRKEGDRGFVHLGIKRSMGNRLKERSSGGWYRWMKRAGEASGRRGLQDETVFAVEFRTGVGKKPAVRRKKKKEKERRKTGPKRQT